MLLGFRTPVQRSGLRGRNHPWEIGETVIRQN
jgi:hypothetical protein